MPARVMLWLALCVVGTVLPYAAFVPWLIEEGPALSLLVEEMFANRIAAFFALDVLVSGAVLIVWVAADRHRFGRWWWLSIAALFSVGVSLALPLGLLLRELHSNPPRETPLQRPF